MKNFILDWVNFIAIAQMKKYIKKKCKKRILPPLFFCDWGSLSIVFSWGKCAHLWILRHGWVYVEGWWDPDRRIGYRGLFFTGGEIPVMFRVGIHDSLRTCWIIESLFYAAYFSPPPKRGGEYKCFRGACISFSLFFLLWFMIAAGFD